MELKTFPYYPTSRAWRRKEFEKFIRYQGYLWKGIDIKNRGQYESQSQIKKRTAGKF